MSVRGLVRGEGERVRTVAVEDVERVDGHDGRGEDGKIRGSGRSSTAIEEGLW